VYTLVTACKNREGHLTENLYYWVKIPKISEIIIVDWSNHRPLFDLEKIDRRIKVLRVENEPKWILSYAYNFGISHASNSYILKIDADCRPDNEITEFIPGTRHFFAGFWKTGQLVDKASINGQCIFTKKQFDDVNGYSELIRTYGRDDEDLYDRFILHKNNRIDIPPEYFNFIKHDDFLRTKEQFKVTIDSDQREYIISTPIYNEMRNLYLGRNLVWGQTYKKCIFIEKFSNDTKYYIRDKNTEITLPDEINKSAKLFSLRYLASIKLQKSMNETASLSEDSCWNILSNIN
jgi:hypothetical protein